MSIGLELHLEGEEANEDSLLDLIDWLERANIEGLEIRRKEPPHTKGAMGILADPAIIITMVSGVIGLADIAINVAGWRRNKEIKIAPLLVNPTEVLQENEAKIQELLAEMKGKVHRNK